MIVLYQNGMYDLDMSYDLFESLKRVSPSFRVTLTEVTKSTYKKVVSTEVKNLTDYSIARNILALSVKYGLHSSNHQDKVLKLDPRPGVGPRSLDI